MKEITVRLTRHELNEINTLLIAAKRDSLQDSEHARDDIAKTFWDSRVKDYMRIITKLMPLLRPLKGKP